MAYRLIDDYSGEPLERNHPKTDVVVGGEGWRLYLSEESKAKLYEALEPFTKDADPIEDTYRPRSARPRSGRGRSAVNTYGFDFHEVRAWAVANKVKAKSGKPISESTRVLNQDVYDAFRQANG